MFGQNEIVGKKFFAAEVSRAAAEGGPRLMVTSVFFTLQGEGPYSGRPAVFVRLSKCSLACNFCDTFFDAGDWKTFPEIELLIEEAVRGYFEEQKVPGGVPAWAQEITLHSGIILVITGGEPLLQDHITAFCKTQLKRFAAIQVESNGIADTELPSGVKLVCSPKCSEKNGKAVAYLKPSNTIIARADCLKFVISADAESPYHTIPDWAFEWRHRNPWKPIYVSPMNVYNTMPQKAKLLRLSKDGKSLPTMEERSTVDEVVSFWEEGLLNKEANQKNHEYAARYCMTHNLRFNLQTHLFASLA